MTLPVISNDPTEVEFAESMQVVILARRDDLADGPWPCYVVAPVLPLPRVNGEGQDGTVRETD